jgi:hypothetical protein
MIEPKRPGFGVTRQTLGRHGQIADRIKRRRD